MTRGNQQKTTDTPRMTRGRSVGHSTKTKYSADRPRQAFELALLGATNEDMARVMDVSVQTIEYWCRTKPEFRNRMNEGKMAADAKVARALFESATGYSHPDCQIFLNTIEVMDDQGNVIERRKEPLIVETVKHYPPNAFAAFKWLTIRQRSKWTDIMKSQVEHTHRFLDEEKQKQLENYTEDELLLAEKLGVQKLLNIGANGN